VIRTTIGSLLTEGTAALREAASATPRLDAELLLGHVMRADRASLLAQPETAIGPDHAADFRALVERRAAGEPVAYIRGIKEFYGLALSVDPRALIPRPETELLVDLALDRLRELLTAGPRQPGAGPLLVWDVGTGSGAVAVALAVECRRRRYAGDVRLRATDVSPDALALATQNAVAHAVADMIDFIRADLTDLGDATGAGGADLLVANLPYIPSAVLPGLPVAASFEPRLALDGGTDGLALLRRLIAELPHALGPTGIALLEIGSDQEDEVRATVQSVSGLGVAIHLDLGGLPRVAEIQRLSAP
jgi:release factor glutamine methyltransferase